MLGPRTIKHVLIDQSSDGCLRHVLQHTAAIVNTIREFGTDRETGRRADSEVPGTGTPMKWREHHFILSAAHVFDKAAPKDLRVFAYSNLPITYKSPESLTRDDIVDGVPLTDASVMHRCKWEDLAVVTIDVTQFLIEPEKDWIQLISRPRTKSPLPAWKEGDTLILTLTLSASWNDVQETGRCYVDLAIRVTCEGREGFLMGMIPINSNLHDFSKEADAP